MQRERIMEETIVCIHHSGFTFTISELAKRLGTSKRTIYNFFDSKDELIESVIEKLITQIKLREQEIASDQQIGTIEKLRQILCTVPKQFEWLDVRLLAELKKHHYDQWTKLDRFLRTEWDTVFQLFEQGIEEGLVRRINFQTFIELYIGILNQEYTFSAPLQPSASFKEKLEEVIDILLYGIAQKRT